MSTRTVTVHNQGTSVITLRDSKTGNTYRLGDHEGNAKGIIKHPTSASIPADEWERIAKMKATQHLLTDANTTRLSSLRVG